MPNYEKCEKQKNEVAELCIGIGKEGQAVVTKKDEIEFHDCLPVTVEDLEYVLQEAKEFIKYRKERNEHSTV